jgi:hypothetical protein
MYYHLSMINYYLYHHPHWLVGRGRFQDRNYSRRVRVEGRSRLQARVTQCDLFCDLSVISCVHHTAYARTAAILRTGSSSAGSRQGHRHTYAPPPPPRRPTASGGSMCAQRLAFHFHACLVQPSLATRYREEGPAAAPAPADRQPQPFPGRSPRRAPQSSSQRRARGQSRRRPRTRCSGRPRR